jgi:small-conductance mechanosensitive channel
MNESLQGLIDWLTANGIPLAIGTIAIFLLYRWARPAIHRMLEHVMRAQTAGLEGDPLAAAEADKRIDTIEDLVGRLLRLFVGVAIVVLFLGVFDLWPILAGLGLVIAGITLAGQSIVLDYLMGFLILLEAQYFKGDRIRIGTVEGTVMEVGFRRTIVRDNRGVLHSVSNGLIRESANLTRTYAVATIEIDGIADRDVETAIEALDEIGRAMAEDPAWADKIVDVPSYAGTIRLSAAGATLRLRGRVHPDARMPVEAELRRRAAAALSARGIEPIRPGATASPTP